MGGIFISYRREDSAAWARGIWQRLVEEFGHDQVFMDVDSLAPGENFVEVIDRYVESVDVMLVVIGRRWLDASDSEGQRRLDNDADLVGIEVGGALDGPCRVIPVLVDEAVMPPVSSLPERLTPLGQRQALKVSHETFARDVDHLVASLRPLVGARPAAAESGRRATGASADAGSGGRHRRRVLVGLAVLIVGVVVGAVLLLTAGSGDDATVVAEDSPDSTDAESVPATTEPTSEETTPTTAVAAATDEVTATAVIGTEPRSAVAGDDGVWVGNRDTVTRVNPETNRATGTIDTGGEPTAVALGEDAVWVVSYYGRTLTRIDRETDEVVSTVDLDTIPRGVAASDDAVWVGGDGNSDGTEVLRIDPATEEVVAEVDVLHNGVVFFLAVTSDAVWAAAGSNRLGQIARIDPATNEVVDMIDVGAGDGEVTGLAVTADAVWVSLSNDTVTRIDPATDEIVAEIEVGANPSGVAATEDGAWVANRDDGTVSRIDPATNSVVATIEVYDELSDDPGYPYAVAVNDAAVWVTLDNETIARIER